VQSDDNEPPVTETAAPVEAPLAVPATGALRPKRFGRRKRGAIKQRQPKPIDGCGTAFLTPDQTCELLGINRPMLLKLEARGVLKPVRLGHLTVRYRLSDIERMASE
jgi:predicted DNA-binding transcriptional regulator AlpA